ncbi:MAG TPA: CUAEP/CCAEP-tail radical SAM protein [Anaeromyxobacteraceae bacterium]|nr:CUAEP/CCAEP-tail radical SAM protein [Anaeromyxobacteraceae bacterium]
MRAPGDILLVSTYELGHVPHGVAVPAGFLARAGYHPAALDLSVEPWDAARVARARLVVFSVPMHTALRLGIEAARRVRREHPGARLAFHGLYAPLNADLLVSEGACAVLGGECEEDLVALAGAVERGEDLRRFVLGAPGVRAQGQADEPAPERASGGLGGAILHPPVRRLDHPVPDRSGLPALSRYARFDAGDGTRRVAGYTEASRGCKHLCRHCPIPPVYGGKFVAVDADVVVEDVARQVSAGAEHLTFGDPDFLNGPTHALRVARAVHGRFPSLTFDFTAKIEHLVREGAAVAELARLGAVFVTSAVESLSDRVLAKLAKGHGRAEALAAFDRCREARLPLRPSLVPFTPWETLDGYLEMLEVFEARGWLPHLDPVQLTIRLLVPPGSLLESDPEIRFDGLDRAALGWRWRHPDPRMDALQARVAAEVEAAAGRAEDPLATLARIRVLALAAAGLPHEHVRVLAPDQRRVPRLTESWFC